MGSTLVTIQRSSFVYLLPLQGAEIGYTGTATGRMDGEGPR